MGSAKDTEAVGKCPGSPGEVPSTPGTDEPRIQESAEGPLFPPRDAANRCSQPLPHCLRSRAKLTLVSCPSAMHSDWYTGCWEGAMVTLGSFCKSRGLGWGTGS